MEVKELDVLGIGNAIVDVLAHADERFLEGQGLEKGAMALIDAARAAELYGAMGPGLECSGGSAANTVAGLASFGAKAGYIGKVRDDQLGEIFRHDLEALGVAFETRPATEGPPTARCLVLVTPDAQRTMATYLGACVELGPDDIDPMAVAMAQVTYLEGYLWDPPAAKEAFRRAIAAAHGAGRKVALSLSDAFCVERWRDEFHALVAHEIDILFANEAEITALYRVGSFDEALAAVRDHCELAALTRSEKGSVVVAGGDVHLIDAHPVDQVVDTTGAGDLYAAGFLYGYTRGEPPARCARFGGLAAAEVIAHFGARPETPLVELAAAAL